VAFVLAVKFAQLYFPPRTVSLDYIMAQCIGALIGLGLFIGGRRPLALARHRLRGRGRAALIIVLLAYSLALFAFFLFPFDVVLSSKGLHARIQELPVPFFSVPGGDAAGPWRLLAPLAEAIETVPVGLLIGLNSRRPRVLVVGGVGLLGMSGICLLQIFILSSTPHLASILLRTVGLMAGASAVGHVNRLGLIRWRLNLARNVPLLAMAYLVGVAASKGLLAANWRTPAEAWAALDWRGLVPFWDSYIVSKTHAVVSTVAHILLYAPIGAMVWLRRGARSGSCGYAAALSVILSFLVEVGRWMRPQFQPDFSNVIIAGVAAAGAVLASDWIWRVLEESFPSPGLPPLEPRLGRPRARAMPRSSLQTDPEPGLTPWRILAAFGCIALTVVVLARYPLAPWPLALALGAYAVLLLRWPVIWLLVVPAILPAVDLAPWTGWLYVGESDLFVMVTAAVLLLRSPPAWTDLTIGKFAFAAILLACLVYALSIGMGLWLVPVAPTDNPYLSAWDGLRIAKGFFAALFLFPFLAREVHRRSKALTWLGAGMVVGLAFVSTAAIAERVAFVSLVDFTTDYRVAATFSSMHVGGGLIDGYLAMAIPFLLLCMAAPRILVVFGALLAIAAVYTLIVTYARTVYAAAVLAVIVSSVGWAVASYRPGGRRSVLLVPVTIAAAFALAVVGAAFHANFMHQRVERAASGLAAREHNWTDGWAVRDPGLTTTLLGMGLGTYPRTFRARATAEAVGSNLLVSHDEAGRWLTITAGAPGFYFGQKVAATQPGDYTVRFAFRSPNPNGSVSVIMCEKLLLYSDHCSAASFKAAAPGKWSVEVGVLHMELAPPRLGGLLRRPVDLAFHVASPGDAAEIRAIRLYNPEGQQIIHNGDFLQGLARWYFTDDDHTAWRMQNEFLMVLFEQGLLGVVSYLMLIAAALWGLWHEMRGGNKAAAPIAGAIVGFLSAGLFNYLLEAPRLSTLFYLLCFTGLLCTLPARRPTSAPVAVAKGANR